VKPDLHAKTIKLTTMVSWYGTSCGLDVKKIKRLRRFPGLIRVVHVPDGKNSKHSFPKPVGIRWPRDMTVTELLVFFDRNAPKIEIFMVVPPFFLSLYNLTGGSGVRGKAGPNCVRKVFNCIRSL
jgi:hypothetical protein